MARRLSLGETRKFDFTCEMSDSDSDGNDEEKGRDEDWEDWEDDDEFEAPTRYSTLLIDDF